MVLKTDEQIYEFENFIINYEKLIYNVAYRMFGNSEDAKDVAQEVCIKLYNGFERYKNITSIKTFIYKVTYNTCIDELRKRKGKSTVDIEEIYDISDNRKNPEHSYILSESIDEIKKSIEKLSYEHKMLIILRDINNLSYKEISVITELSLGTVKSRINRARQKLKEIIIQEREQKGL